MNFSLSRCHFLQLERSQKSQDVSVKSVIKDHFNKPVFKVDSDIAESKRCMELKVTSFPVQKGVQPASNPVVFRITTSSYSVPTSYTSCTLLSPTGMAMGCILNVKDKGLSTSYNITDSKHVLALEVTATHNSTGANREFSVKRVSENDVIARVQNDERTVSLSMRPEVDEDTKKRLLTFMIFQELIEKSEEFDEDNMAIMV